MERFAPQTPGKISEVAATIHARKSLVWRLGFDQVMHAGQPHPTLLPSVETYADPDRSARIIRASFASHGTMASASVLGREARVPLEILTAQSSQTTTIGRERNSFTQAALLSGQFDALIGQDPGYLMRSAMRILRAGCDRREPLASQEKIRIELCIRENL